MIETKNEIQMICNSYFLHMIRNTESSSWLEFTVHEDDIKEFEVEFDISFPNCCRIRFYEALKETEKEIREQQKKIMGLRQKLIDIRNILDRDI